MNNIVSAAAPLTLTIGPPVLLFIVNPYVFYGSLLILLFTCLLICVHIINNCTKREKRIAALKTRAIRRAYAKSAASDSEHGSNPAPD